jgi:hypothetical protein
MRLKVLLALALLVAGIPVVTPILAQEGHPLTGSWYGEWGKDAENITMIVKYDNKLRDKAGEYIVDPDTKKEKLNIDKNGKHIFAATGMYNPGANSAIVTMTLDSAKWMVHIETDFKDDAGKVSHVVADGKLENLGSYARTITGTWTQGTVKGNFKIKRD